MKAVIIDDELNGREILTLLIKRHVPEVKEIHTADSAASGIEMILEQKPDVVFLDVEMPDGNGFVVLDDERICEMELNVIFTTAYEHYALKAIKYAALDYLLKPVDIDELKAAVKKSTPESKQTVSELIQRLVGPGEQLDRVRLVSKSGFELVSCKDILFCRSESNYTRFTMTDGSRKLVSKTMGTYQEQLEKNGFMRIHKSHIVQLSGVVRYIHGKTGQVEMSDGSVMDVGKEMKAKLLSRL